MLSISRGDNCPHRPDGEITLVSMGPKPHVLASILVAMRFQEVACLRVSGTPDPLGLPDLTLKALRALWVKHRHPDLLFPNATGSLETIRKATTHMDRGGSQKAMKVVVEECGIKKKSISTPFVTALPLICLNKV